MNTIDSTSSQDGGKTVSPVEAASAPLPPPSHDGAGAASHVPVHFSRRTGLHVIIAALAVAAGLTAIHLFRAHHAATAQTELSDSAQQVADRLPTVNVVKVEAAGADASLKLPGQCRALFETTVFARINGYVRKWNFDIGDHVKEGDVLATIDTPELDQEIQVAQAKLASLEADVTLAKASVDFARTTNKRFEGGPLEGVVSQQEADQKKSELDVSLAKLESAKAQVALGQADVRRLQAMADFKRVTAPFDGVVTQRHTDIGQLVTAGSTNSTSPLFTISRSDKIRVFVDVPQSARPGITVGTSSDIAVREFPGRTFRGRVDRTSEAINPASGTLRVEVMVPNDDGALLPGMFVQATFLSRRAHPPVKIPAGSLLLLADGPHVGVVGADNCIHIRPIKIARDMGDIIEVSDGLSEADTIALNLSHEITDGQKVTPTSAGTTAKPAADLAHESGAGPQKPLDAGE